MTEHIIKRCGENFYRIIGLNMESWLDILFPEHLSNDELRSLQSEIRSCVPWDSYRFSYQPHTEIREKMDAIKLLELTLQMEDKNTVTRLLLKIQNDYSTAGTYFADQCEWMRGHIKD